MCTQFSRKAQEIMQQIGMYDSGGIIIDSHRDRDTAYFVQLWVAMVKAKVHFMHGDIESAHKACKQILAAHPNHEAALDLLNRCKGDYLCKIGFLAARNRPFLVYICARGLDLLQDCLFDRTGLTILVHRCEEEMNVGEEEEEVYGGDEVMRYSCPLCRRGISSACCLRHTVPDFSATDSCPCLCLPMLSTLWIGRNPPPHAFI